MKDKISFDSRNQFLETRGVVAGRAGGPWSPNFSKSLDFQKFKNVLSEKFWTFAVGENKGFKFYRKVFELVPPTLQVPQGLCWRLFDVITLLAQIGKYVVRAEDLPRASQLLFFISFFFHFKHSLCVQ